MNMWQEGTVLPIKDVRISGGMVHGTCPILVEGNEYIFRYCRQQATFPLINENGSRKLQTLIYSIYRFNYLK